ncbi:MAG: acyl-CoA dehydrogenase family protein [Candidatus Kapabacteria bacterium]|nr:acyl-CoA dehydrogenase family protein [Candidatus Kapabacteria bacterium]
MFSTSLSETQEQIMLAARKIAKEEVFPGSVERDANAEFSRDILNKLGELGFLGMMVPEELGGAGFDAVSYALAIKEIAKADASVSIVLSVQNSLVNWILQYYANDTQKEKFLKPLAQGIKIGSYCLSEPEAGSDATQQHTIATKTDGGWILNGMKNWISTGINADLNIVFAQTNSELKHKGITCFIVERGTQGWEPLKGENKMGMRASDTCSIAITNCFVPDENVIGSVGQGFTLAMESLNGGRIGIAAQAVGIAEAAFEASVKYAKERITFGKPIIEHQMIQSKLAQMSAKIDASLLLVLKAAHKKDMHENFIQDSAEAKMFASATAVEVTREAVQIHGGYGYVREYLVERYYRDAKVTEIYEGTSEIQTIVIARELMKKY